jgi:hypothetical protein
VLSIFIGKPLLLLSPTNRNPDTTRSSNAPHRGKQELDQSLRRRLTALRQSSNSCIPQAPPPDQTFGHVSKSLAAFVDRLTNLLSQGAWTGLHSHWQSRTAGCG